MFGCMPLFEKLTLENRGYSTDVRVSCQRKVVWVIKKLKNIFNKRGHEE
jgi:hypothetical protein